MTLWHNGNELNQTVHTFTVGNDWKLDNQLVFEDACTNLAHAHALQKAGLLSKNEVVRLKHALVGLTNLHSKGKFVVTQGDEDVHTAVENYLTAKLGSLGAKIHAGKSRNDQVLCDLRLYTKKQLLQIGLSTIQLANELAAAAQKHSKTLVPGFTHTRKAMPSTMGLWFAAHAQGLSDDATILLNALALVDECPLGSAAGYGSQLPLDRALEAKLLGFSKAQPNVLYVQNSRPKLVVLVLSALEQVMLDLAKLSADVIFYSLPEFGFLELPEKYCTGSSIMPHKKNPDVFELARAYASVVSACHFQVVTGTLGLMSGYHRDFQLTKEPLLKGLNVTSQTLDVLNVVIPGLKINDKACQSACTPEIFSAWNAIQSAKQGVPFRHAYRQTAKKLNTRAAPMPSFDALFSNKLAGSPGALELPKLESELAQKHKTFQKQSVHFKKALEMLLS